MATFLTTSKMNPALAARVDKSVRGGRSPVLTRRTIAIGRFALVLGLTLAVYGYVTSRKLSDAELERARSELLDAVAKEVALLDDGDRETVAHVEPWLDGFAAPSYARDVVADELRAPGAFAETLARSTIYVRGPIDGFSSSAITAQTAETSRKDAFLFCLLSPPESRAEKVVLEKVRLVYNGDAATTQRTASVHRLHDAIVGLPLLSPAWTEQVKGADEIVQIERLRKKFDGAPLDGARGAAKAPHLLAVVDEPGEGDAPTELDGERAHFIRVSLVNLRTSQVLLSLRRSVDPAWISVERRAMYAGALDSCALAFDIHELVGGR